MRWTLVIVVVVVVACGKGGDKPAPGGSGPASGPPSTGPVKQEKTVKGTLTMGGAMTGTFAWKDGDAFDCACIAPTNWQIDVTMTDGTAYTALTLSSSRGINMTSGALSTPEPLQSPTGVTGSCKPDNWNADGVISIDVDGKPTGKAGEVTVKGHLDAICRPHL